MKKYIFLFLVAFYSFMVFAQNNGSLVVYNLKIDEPIYESLAKRIVLKLRNIDKDKAKLILLEINSSGGKIEDAFSICDEFDILAERGIPVYAYIKQAHGASALVAIACEKIYMQPDSSLGNAEIKKTFGKVAPDTLSSIKSRFGEYANRKEVPYPIRLIESFVDPEMQIREISYAGARQFKTEEEFSNDMNDPLKNKNIHDRGIIVKKGEIGVFSGEKCKNFGICRAIYESKEKLMSDLNLEEFFVEKVANPSSNRLSNFLTNKWVMLLFLTIGLLGIMVEMLTPGLGVPCISGLSCISLFFIGGYYSGLAEPWEISLFVFGLIFLALEVFVITGFGVAGIIGIILCFVSIILSMQSFALPSNDQEMKIFFNNIVLFSFSLGANLLIFTLIYKAFPNNRPLGQLSLNNVQKLDDGYTVDIEGYSDLQDKTGKVVSELRPSGKVQIGEEVYDVLSQGDLIEEGEDVKVILVQGNRIFVEKINIQEK